MKGPTPMLDINSSVLERIVALDNVVSCGMTTFQMEHFVMNDQITPNRRARQAIIEARGLMENQVTLEIDLDEALHKLNNSDLDQFERRRTELIFDRKSKMLDQGAKEIKFFADALEKVVYDNFGSFEEFQAMLSDESWVNEEEGKYWVATLSNKARDDIFYSGSISQGVAAAMLLMPKELTAEAFKCLNDKIVETNKYKLLGK